MANVRCKYYLVELVGSSFGWGSWELQKATLSNIYFSANIIARHAKVLYIYTLVPFTNILFENKWMKLNLGSFSGDFDRPIASYSIRIALSVIYRLLSIAAMYGWASDELAHLSSTKQLQTSRIAPEHDQLTFLNIAKYSQQIFSGALNSGDTIKTFDTIWNWTDTRQKCSLEAKHKFADGRHRIICRCSHAIWPANPLVLSIASFCFSSCCCYCWDLYFVVEGPPIKYLPNMCYLYADDSKERGQIIRNRVLTRIIMWNACYLHRTKII